MANSKLNLRGLSTADKIARARQLIQDLAENLEFSTATSPLAQATIAVDALESAYSDMHCARQLALSKTSLLHEKEGALESVLQNLASEIIQVKRDVETPSNGAGKQYDGGVISANPIAGVTVVSPAEAGTESEIAASWSKVRTFRRYSTGRSQSRVLPLRLSPKGLN
jgi:hypothetical protein